MPLIYVNDAFTQMSGYAPSEILGKNCRFLQGEDRQQEARFTIKRAIETGEHCKVLIKNYHKNGTPFWNELIISPIRDAAGELTHFVGVQNDVTEREEARKEAADKTEQLKDALGKLQETQSMLVHSEKMNALGQMVAGVAHEINNPIAFVASNLHTLRLMTNDLLELVTEADTLIGKNAAADVIASFEKAKDKADVDFITEDVVDLFASSADGVERIKSIVGNLRNFARLDEAEFKTTSLKECIESTLKIASATTTDRLKVSCQLDDLEPLKCRPAELNQVFLNLILNASQAVESDGILNIRGFEREGCVVIEFEDNGKGMDEETKAKIFDPFFTTKPVGEGTGLGLSIAYKIITEGHQGRVEVSSQPGNGTTFVITLPRPT